MFKDYRNHAQKEKTNRFIATVMICFALFCMTYRSLIQIYNTLVVGYMLGLFSTEKKAMIQPIKNSEAEDRLQEQNKKQQQQQQQQQQQSKTRSTNSRKVILQIPDQVILT
jgi:hypothetical protein